MKLRPRFVSPMIATGLVIVLGTTGIVGAMATAPPDPHATEANITRLTTNILERSQFGHKPFDDALAAKFLDRYIDSLDPSRSLFLTSDIDDFAAFRTSLSKATRDAGDTRAADAIFRRFLERLAEQASYATDTLRATTFDFSGHDDYSPDREHAERPRDLNSAQVLWRQQLRAEYLREKLTDKPAAKIVDALTKRYSQRVRTMQAFTRDEVLDVYLNALAHVYDPHSDYFGHEQMASFSTAMSLSLVGIGATLESADGTCTIRGLVPGGPAARAGVLKPGDRILAVSQTGKDPVDITNMPLSRAVGMIRGPKGSSVTLTVLPVGLADGATPRAVTLVRDAVNLKEEEAKARIVDLQAESGATVRVGVIELPSFYADMGGQKGTRPRSATADVSRLLTKLQDEHVRGVVLDLRHNGGGSLQEAVALTGLFIRKGAVVQTRDPSGAVQVEADNDPAILYDGPLVVLTSRFSASASEIVTGALQDYGRALVVGDASTFGKGTVQNVLALAQPMDRMGVAHAYDPGALKVTIRKFYRPSGASTQLRGVPSDIVLPSMSDLGDVSESSLKEPLPWDVIAPTPYENLDLVRPYVPALRAKSNARVNASPEFRHLEEDMARLKTSLASKSISMNEGERRKEIAEAKMRRRERTEEAQVHHVARPTTYAVTLENASSPGLPTPMAFDDAGEKAAVKSVTHPPKSDATDEALGYTSFDEALLQESEHILADYVDLVQHDSLNGKPGVGSTRN